MHRLLPLLCVAQFTEPRRRAASGYSGPGEFVHGAECKLFLLLIEMEVGRDTASVGLYSKGIVLQWLNDSLTMCLGNSGSQMQAGDSSNW